MLFLSRSECVFTAVTMVFALCNENKLGGEICYIYLSRLA